MQPIALISGLIGALVSAALSFWVRYSLDQRAQRETEKRLAYVYLVKITDVVAVDMSIRTIVKALVPQSVRNEMAESTNSKFTPSHKISVILAEAFQKLTEEDVKSNQQYKVMPAFVKSQLESSKGLILTADQLSRLPKDVIFSINRFHSLLGSALQVVELWGALFEKGENYWATPEGIHDQWMTLVRFSDAAQGLRLALIRLGAAEAPHANQLLSTQVGFILETVRVKWSDQPKLVAATLDGQNPAS